MLTEQAVDTIVTLRPEPSEPDTRTLEALPSAPEEAAVRPAGGEERAAPGRPRRRWLLPVAIGAAGLIASGTLGGFLWSTIGQRDAARHQLVTSQATLADTRGQLAAARTDAATRKLKSDYVTLVTAEGGQAVADYGGMAVCNSFGACRTVAQQTLTDLQAFQAHRAAATVPPELVNADGALRDALSAAIAAVQEVITGADNDDIAKVKDGAKKLDAALLSIGKAQAAVGAGSS